MSALTGLCCTHFSHENPSLEKLPVDVLVEHLYRFVPEFVTKSPSRFFGKTSKRFLACNLNDIFHSHRGNSHLFGFIHQRLAPWENLDRAENPKNGYLALRDKTGDMLTAIPFPDEILKCDETFEKMQDDSLKLVWSRVLRYVPGDMAPPDALMEAHVIREWMYNHREIFGRIPGLPLEHLSHSNQNLMGIWLREHEELSRRLERPDPNASVMVICDWLNFHTPELQHLLNFHDVGFTPEEHALINIRNNSSLTPRQLRRKLELISMFDWGLLEHPLILPKPYDNAETIREWMALHPGVLELSPSLKLNQLYMRCVPDEIILFTGLVNLNLDNNAIRILPSQDVFHALPRLECLSLANNQLRTLRPGVFGCANSLHSLYLHGNPLTAIPFNKIYPLTCLSGLTLDEKLLIQHSPNCSPEMTDLFYDALEGASRLKLIKMYRDERLTYSIDTTLRDTIPVFLQRTLNLVGEGIYDHDGMYVHEGTEIVARIPRTRPRPVRLSITFQISNLNFPRVFGSFRF